MRTAQEWEAEIKERGWHYLASYVEAIQADARRQAISECASICAHAVRYHSMKCRQALKTTRRDIADSHKAASDTAGECARTIEALLTRPEEARGGDNNAGEKL